MKEVSNPPSLVSPELDLDRRAQADTLTRVQDSFRDIYLTLTSVIQGVTFGYLVEVSLNQGIPSGDRLIKSSAALLMIIAIWQEYMVGATMFAWIPGSRDAVVPFALGVGECYMIKAIDLSTHDFLAGILVVCVLGLLAEGNYYLRSRNSQLPLTQSSMRVLRRHPQTGWLLTLAAALFYGGLLAASVRWPSSASLLLWLASVMPLGTLLSSRLRFGRFLSRARSLPTPRASDE